MATKMDPLDLQRKRIPNPRGIIIEGTKAKISMNVSIRNEQAEDIDSITRLIRAALEDNEQ